VTTTKPGAPSDASRPEAQPSAERLGWAASGLAGLLTGAAAIGLAEALSTVWSRTGLQHGVASPVLAVGGTFVDHTPGWLKDFAITHFGSHDKQALLSGIGLTLVLLSVVAGLVARRRTEAGLAVVGVLGLVAAYAVLTRPNSWPLDVVPTVVGIAAGLWVLRALVMTYGGGSASGWSRRRFLVAAGATAAIAAVTGGGSRLLRTGSADVAASRKAVRLPTPAEPLGPIPGAVMLPVPGITPYKTSNEKFYRVDTALSLPQLRAEDWRLRVHGMVGHEVHLDFNDLLSKPLVERAITLTCVSNEVGGKLLGNAVWLGYPLKDLLSQANPDGDADMVLSTSVDGMTISTPLAELMDGRDAMLAVAMNGEPLPVAHGFPVRMVVPGLYGYVSATKWVTDLKVTRFDRDKAYWTPRGYSAKAPIKTSSRIDVPASFANVRRGKVAVAGVAWAQTRGISKVEARVDGGAWQEARLADSLSKDTWRQWVWEWDATSAGTHTIECRATDGSGYVQTSELARIRPDGTTGWDSVVVKVA
jgi:DMSO/TMAO reductase YedYZ molybdopterin-dependent catalytic subunit